MAGSITVTASEVESSGGVRKYSVDWTSDAAGAVSGSTFAMAPGTVIAATFTPDSGGTQPTNLYDVTILCAQHSVDVLNGAGADLDNSPGNHRGVFIQTADKTAFARQWLHGGVYQPVVANAGNAKGGVIDIYVAAGVV